MPQPDLMTLRRELLRRANAAGVVLDSLLVCMLPRTEVEALLDVIAHLPEEPEGALSA